MISSLRWRITAWYLAFFALLFVVFGLYVYGVLARSLESRLDVRLTSEASTEVGLFADELDEMKGDVVRAAPEAVSEMHVRDSVIAILGGGRVLAAGDAGADGALRQVAEIAASHPEAEFTLTLGAFGRHGAHAAVHRTTAVGANFLIVSMGSLDSIAADLALVRGILLFGLPFLLGIAGLGGYAVASRNLAPLRWMAEQARRITGNSLDTRLEIGDAAAELETLAASFNELLARLDQSFAAMKRFVADASHELRTPLAVIHGEADVALACDRPAGEYKQSLATILDESRRLSRLVDDLLNLARADAGGVRLQVAEFYFNDLLAECCRSLQALAAARKVTLECLPAEDVVFRGDEALLRRLVVNLLDNAIRYTPPGGRITATLEARGEEVWIRISDTGVGIAPEAASHIFERFYRADKARSRAEGGFGLGLSIVKWIAESHRGAVSVSSLPEEGSTFTVTLPRGNGG
jgi:two-component system, OmpR family, sensor kinase